jgi:hypothetical protein
VSKLAVMLSEGVVMATPADMAKCWPDIWATPKAAKHWVTRQGWRGVSQNALENTLIKQIGTLLPPPRVTYQLAGAGQRARCAWFDLSLIPAPRGWLEARLGALAHYELEQRAAEPASQPAAAPEAEPAPPASRPLPEGAEIIGVMPETGEPVVLQPLIEPAVTIERTPNGLVLREEAFWFMRDGFVWTRMRSLWRCPRVDPSGHSPPVPRCTEVRGPAP